MISPISATMSDPGNMAEVLAALKSIQQTQAGLVSAVDSLSRDSPVASSGAQPVASTDAQKEPEQQEPSDEQAMQAVGPSSPSQRSGGTSRIILT